MQQHPTCTVPTSALRVGKGRCALLMLAAMSLPVALVLILALGSDKLEEDAPYFALLLAFFGVPILSGFLLAPRAIVRVSPWGIRVRSYGAGKSSSMTWNDIDGCLLTSATVGVRHAESAILLRKTEFQKDDWNKVRDTAEQYLSLHHGTTIESERARSRRMWTRKTMADYFLRFFVVVFLAVYLFAVPVGVISTIIFPSYGIAIIAAIVIGAVPFALILRKDKAAVPSILVVAFWLWIMPVVFIIPEQYHFFAILGIAMLGSGFVVAFIHWGSNIVRSTRGLTLTADMWLDLPRNEEQEAVSP